MIPLTQTSTRRTRRLSVVLSLALLSVTPIGSNADPSYWDEADQKVVRLSPKAFPDLPESVVAYLEKRRCLIPQTFYDPAPHNVVRGAFAVTGQTDLAVLCSVDRVSTILVFWKMSTDSVAEIAQRPDLDDLQGTGDGIKYSRMLYSANSPWRPSTSPTTTEGPEQPEMTHAGIEDAFLSSDGIVKGSVIWYFHENSWHRLQGPRIECGSGAPDYRT